MHKSFGSIFFAVGAIVLLQVPAAYAQSKSKADSSKTMSQDEAVGKAGIIQMIIGAGVVNGALVGSERYSRQSTEVKTSLRWRLAADPLLDQTNAAFIENARAHEALSEANALMTAKTQSNELFKADRILAKAQPQSLIARQLAEQRILQLKQIAPVAADVKFHAFLDAVHRTNITRTGAHEALERQLKSASAMTTAAFEESNELASRSARLARRGLGAGGFLLFTGALQGAYSALASSGTDKPPAQSYGVVLKPKPLPAHFVPAAK